MLELIVIVGVVVIIVVGVVVVGAKSRQSSGCGCSGGSQIFLHRKMLARQIGMAWISTVSMVGRRVKAGSISRNGRIAFEVKVAVCVAFAGYQSSFIIFKIF